MAIRRETVNVWERRAPLAPMHVRQLVKKGVKVIVQPSNRRVYSEQEYTDAGAVIQEDMSEASLLIGVKKIPVEALLPDKTYAFFSRTSQADEDSMPMLDTILEKRIRLVDYAKIMDTDGSRLVAFGTYAGVAGMINILHGMGLRLLALGHHTPFMHIGLSHNYRTKGLAQQAVRDAGYDISHGRMPQSIGPLIFVFIGSGNVSQGAQEMFQDLPHEYIQPEQLHRIAKEGATNKLYACVVSRHHHYEPKAGGKFDAEEFEKHPERYTSTFNQKIAPYASCIINGIYWAPRSPLLISNADAKALLQSTDVQGTRSKPSCPTLPHRLVAICDISSDPGGSFEFMREWTTIGSPFCLYDAEKNTNTVSFTGNGVLICSVDNMPAQIPREATDFFGNLLLPHIPDMLRSDALSSFEEYDAGPRVKNAVIASNGKLTPRYAYINDIRKSRK